MASVPDPPPVPPPQRMASPFDQERERERRMALAASRQRGGFVSTILSESLSNKAGGGGTGAPSRSA